MADVAVTASASSFALPYDFKDVYTLRVITAGRNRTLKGIPRRLYDRAVEDQQNDLGEICGYDLFSKGDQGQLSIHPIPAANDTLRLRYYRRMWVPCSVSASVIATGNADTQYCSATGEGAWYGLTQSTPIKTLASGWVLGVGQTRAIANLITPTTMYVSGATYTATANGTGTMVFGGDEYSLDLPEDYENAILSHSIHHFLNGLGAPGSKLNYWIQAANDEFQEARAANERFEDQDLGFEFQR